MLSVCTVFLPILPNKLLECIEAPVPILVGVVELPQHLNYTKHLERGTKSRLITGIYVLQELFVIEVVLCVCLCACVF